MQCFSKRRILQLSVAMGLLGCSSAAFPSAFQIWEQDASGTGDYHAGAAAEADGAGTEYYNPAGMTRLKHQQISTGGVFIPINVSVTGQVLGQQIPGPISGNTRSFIPNFHYVIPIAKRWAVGFGVTTPFGLSTSYAKNPDNIVSFESTNTKLLTINYNFNVAYAITDSFSVGVGFDELYGKAVYNNLNPLDNSEFQNSLSGYATGYNIGLLYQFSPETRVGLSYRSKMTIKGAGYSTLSTFTTKENADFPLPATAMLSYYEDIGQHWAVMSSVFYTWWTAFTTLTLNNTALPAIGQPSSVAVHENYKNTWNFAAGVHYKINRQWVLKLGGGYDQTPTRTGYRDSRLPDTNRIALAAGVHYQPISAIGLDLGYTHLFTPPAVVDNTEGTRNTVVPAITGHAKNEANVYGMQLEVTF